MSHSISPLLHNYLFEKTALQGCYTRTLLQSGSEIKEHFFSHNLSGANVTVPFKEDAFLQCDEVRGIACNIKAVNTLVNENGKLIGYNTDAPGLYQSICECKMDFKKVLILGAGGTAKAIAMQLLEKQFELTVANRSQNRLDFFENLGIKTTIFDLLEPHSYDLIINTTPAGLKEDIYPLKEQLLCALFSQAHYAIDVIYNKHTPFLCLASQSNLACKDGTEMLINQGILAFNLFTQHNFDLRYLQALAQEAFALLD